MAYQAHVASDEGLRRRPLAVINGARTVIFVRDHHIGQPQKMANASGAVSWQRVAGICGDTVSQPVGSTAANPQRFPGQQYDANTTLHYNYYRDYDPATGRYLKTDPIGLDGGMNLYVYANGNPINAVDPSGLSTVTYNGQTQTITVQNSGGKTVGVYPASNKTTQTSNGPWPNGNYPYSYYNRHSESDANGPYGSNGIHIFDVPGRSGMGVHSERANKGGYDHPTLGCIRTTDDATAFLRELTKIDPLTSIKVINNNLNAGRIGTRQ